MHVVAWDYITPLWVEVYIHVEPVHHRHFTRPPPLRRVWLARLSKTRNIHITAGLYARRDVCYIGGGGGL